MVNSMIVYRVEDIQQNGPYMTLQREDWTIRDHNNEMTHPTPQEDGVEDCKITGDHKCGFESRKKLLQWFNKEEREKLHKHGFVISLYKIRKTQYNVLIGHKQLMFDLELAERVGKRHLISLRGI